MNLFQTLLYNTVHLSLQHLQYAASLKYFSTDQGKWENLVNKIVILHWIMFALAELRNNLAV